MEELNVKIKSLVLQLDFEDIVDVLANFFMVGRYWCSLIDWEEKDYEEAKTILQLRMEDEEICQEHVWAEMLINQKPLILNTYENDRKYELTYDKIRYAIGHLLDKERLSSNMYNWDGYDYDNIIQQAIFGDVIYG